MQRLQQIGSQRQRITADLARDQLTAEGRRAQTPGAEGAQHIETGVQGQRALLISGGLRVLIRQACQSGDGACHRQVIPAGAANADPRLVAAHVHLGRPALIRQAGLQPCLVLSLLLGTECEGALVAAIAGPDAVRSVVGRGEVAVVAEHSSELA